MLWKARSAYLRRYALLNERASPANAGFAVKAVCARQPRS
jgi:hypothetical protein